MITVQVDGTSMLTDVGSMNTMGELIELVKASIDPDSIITSLSISGNELSDSDWQAPLSTHRGQTLEVTTGSRDEYVNERLQMASTLVRRIAQEFSEAATFYQKSDWPQGNNTFAVAVEDLLAFVNWYDSILLVDEEKLEANRTEFKQGVDQLQSTCEELLQQQLYNSWWALGETINTKLCDQLGRLEAFCGGVATQHSGN